MRVCVYTGVCVGTGAGERILLKNKTKILKAQHILPLIWLSLCCCAWAFSGCSEWGPLFIVVPGLLIVVEHRL